MKSTLKGLKELTAVINDFTMKNFEVTAKLGTEFAAVPPKRLIYFTFIVSETMQQTTIDDMEARFPHIKADPFFWLLMHEIGHCMTAEIWDTDDEIYFNKMKDRLDDYFEEDIFSQNEWYHVIPDEYFSTKWAGGYMEEYPKKMRKFAKKFHKAFAKFLKKNNAIFA